ncbi:MAG: hypothetical protein JRJ29_19970 [Deltaproteobacteria bacterium]|nr:hypothetical protein [Deltaproteobacteria bacterium]
MSTVFQFSSSASLEMLTGKRASDIQGLLHLIKTCSKSSIFYHTFSAFMKMREIQLPYNSDFASWVYRSLNEKPLAEKLMAIDLSEYSTVEKLRNRLIELIEDYVQKNPTCCEKKGDEPFYLYDVMRVVYLTDKFAYDLASFRDTLERISIYSLYYHFIESRLHTQLESDDFSSWIEESLGLSDLARKIRKIDISVYNLEGLRGRIIQLIDEYLEMGLLDSVSSTE